MDRAWREHVCVPLIEYLMPFAIGLFARCKELKPWLGLPFSPLRIQSSLSMGIILGHVCCRAEEDYSRVQDQTHDLVAQFEREREMSHFLVLFSDSYYGLKSVRFCFDERRPLLDWEFGKPWLLSTASTAVISLTVSATFIVEPGILGFGSMSSSMIPACGLWRVKHEGLI